MPNQFSCLGATVQWMHRILVARLTVHGGKCTAKIQQLVVLQHLGKRLFGLMVHNKVMADHYYLLEEKAAQVVKTSKYLTDVLQAKGPSKEAIATKDVEDGNTSSSSANKWCNRIPEEELKTLFAKEIKDQVISLSTVRDKVRNNPLLKEILILTYRY